MRRLLTPRVIGSAAVTTLLVAVVAGITLRSPAAALGVATLGAVIVLGLQTQRQTRSVQREISRARQAHTRDLAALTASAERQEKTLAALRGRTSTGGQAAVAVPPRPTVMLPFTGEPGPDRSVTLVLDTLTASQLFAGVKTAILAASQVATTLGLPLRIAAMHDPSASDRDVLDPLHTILRDAGYGDLTAGLRLGYPRAGFAPPRRDDVVVVTFWKTAHAVSGLVDAGRLDADRVIYVVQDFEPGFYPWGTDHALAERTYHQDFRLLVNSEPLAEHVRRVTSVPVPPEVVFAPHVDAEALRTSAGRWAPGDIRRPRVLFYARPSKPRNLFPLGVEALHRWILDLPDDVSPVVLVAGERGATLSLPERAEVRSLGQLGLGEYHHLLSEVDMGLALMFSPHPSHLPLELPMAGIPTVTNQFMGVRRPWVPGLLVAAGDERHLATALEQARLAAQALSAHEWQPLPTSMGRPLHEAVAAVTAGLATH